MLVSLSRVPSRYILDTRRPVYQATDYTCGCAEVQSVLQKHHRDVGQSALERELETTPEGGTKMGAMVEAFKRRGLTAACVRESLELLVKRLQEGWSVTVCIQAYGCTHYVGIIGVTRRNVYFIDPSSETGYGHMKRDAFYARWVNKNAVVVKNGKPSDCVTSQEIPE